MFIEEIDLVDHAEEFSDAAGRRRMMPRRKMKRRMRKKMRRASGRKPMPQIQRVASYRSLIRSSASTAGRSSFDGDHLDGTDFNMDF